VERFISSGAVVWLILAVMAVEALVLARLIKSFPGILAGLGAGGCMVLALGASLTNMGAYAVAACLAVSFAFHAVELYFWFKLPRCKASS
jgi:hypothetical protein